MGGLACRGRLSTWTLRVHSPPPFPQTPFSPFPSGRPSASSGSGAPLSTSFRRLQPPDLQDAGRGTPYLGERGLGCPPFGRVDYGGPARAEADSSRRRTPPRQPEGCLEGLVAARRGVGPAPASFCFGGRTSRPRRRSRKMQRCPEAGRDSASLRLPTSALPVVGCLP